MKDTREALLGILRDLHPDIDFETETDLAADGLLDSFDMASLIAQIRAVLDIAIPADQILPRHFRSLDTMCALVDSLR